MAEVKFLLYSDPDFMLVKSIRMQVFMSEQNIKGEEEFDELDKRALFALLYDGKLSLMRKQALKIEMIDNFDQAAGDEQSADQAKHGPDIIIQN